MRTKALLTVAALAAGALSTMAQVYSANIVGYYNVQMPSSSFVLTANQFNKGGNTLNEVLPSAGYGDQVLTFANNNYTIDVFDGSAWLNNDTGDPSATVVAPGKGFFYNNLNATATMTFVGEVPTGNLSLTFPPGFKLVSTMTPAVLNLNSNSFPQVYGMQLLTFANNNYKIYVNDGTMWLDNDTGDPVVMAPAVGQGYFINNLDATTYTWALTFNP